MNESLSQEPEPPPAVFRERILAIIGVFREAMHSVVGRSEFARTMNLVILPAVARLWTADPLEAATHAPADGHGGGMAGHDTD